MKGVLKRFRKTMNGRRKNIFFNVILSFCAASILLLCFSTGAGALEVRLKGERLSIEAEQVPLQLILKQFADQGMKVRIDPDLNPNITASFKDKEIQKGLDSILKSLSHVLIWESIPGYPGPIIKPAEIQVFKPGKKELMKPLHKRSNLEIVKDPSNGSLFVKDELLLRIKKGTSLEEFKKFIERIGGTVIAGYRALGIYRIRLPDDSDIPSIVQEIKNLPEVAEVEPNYAYPISSPYRDSTPGSLSSILSNIAISHEKVSIAILDSGLDLTAGLEDSVLASLDALNPHEPIFDSLGHGTQMALIAAGVVKPYGVREDPETYIPIIPIRAFDDNGFSSNFQLMESVDFAIQNGAGVISLSWGSENRSDFLEDLLDYANSKGLIIVASAGNEPTGTPVYPAAYKSVIGVGALSPDGKTWVNSNYGDFVTLYAPGFAKLPVGYKADPGTYGGTSISTAFVANIIANYLSRNPEATREEVFKALGKR